MNNSSEFTTSDTSDTTTDMFRHDDKFTKGAYGRIVRGGK